MPEPVHAVERALEILLYLHEAGRECSLSKIAADLGIHKSTVYRALISLQAYGFVRQNRETGRYWLGTRLLSLGRSVERQLDLHGFIRPYVKKLYQLYREVVSVSVLERCRNGLYRIVTLFLEEREGQILTTSPSTSLGRDCHCTAAGKCLLAFGEEVDLSAYLHRPLPAYTAYTISSGEDLLLALDHVRQLGYAMELEEREYGVTAISAPILNHHGFAEAALCLSGPTGRMTTGDFEERIRAVQHIAREISAHF